MTQKDIKVIEMEEIVLSKEVLKNLNEYYTKDDFYKDIESFITALQDGRLITEIISVSRSGMSSEIMIKSFECCCGE